jgi:hypothetical protein
VARAELWALSVPARGPERSARLLALGAGLGGRRDVSPRLALWASGTAGLALGWADAGGKVSTGLAPAARLAAGAGLGYAWGAPFVEAGLLLHGGAGSGVGAGAEATVSIGVRLDLEHFAGRSGVHGDHPDRR